MNKLYLIGNLTRDPELTETLNGTKKCRFSLAVNRPYANAGGEKETDFFDCTAWKGTAENIAKYCRKGNKLMIEGSVQLRNYEGNDGNKHLAVDVMVQNAEFLTPRTQNDGGTRSQPSTKPKPQLQVFDDDGDIPF